MDIRKTLKKLEQINEGELSELVPSAEMDHEVQMARSQLFSIAEYAIKLHNLLKHIPEERGIEGWMQAKITKAADYMDAVWHNLEHDLLPPDHELALDVRTTQQPDMGMDVDLTDGIAEEINASMNEAPTKDSMGSNNPTPAQAPQKKEPTKVKGGVSAAQLGKQLGVDDPQVFAQAVMKLKMGQSLSRVHHESLSRAFQKLMAMDPQSTNKAMMLLKRIEASESVETNKKVDEASMKTDPMLKDFDQHMDDGDAKGLAVKIKQAADKSGKDPVGVVKHHMLRLDDYGQEFARKVMQHINNIKESKTTNKTFGFWGE